MDPMIFVALFLFIAVVAAWIVLPGSSVTEVKLTADVMPMLQGQQQA